MLESAALFVPKTLGLRGVRVSLICVYVCAPCTGMGTVRLDDGGGSGTHSCRCRTAVLQIDLAPCAVRSRSSPRISTHKLRSILMMQRHMGREHGEWRRVRFEFLTRAAGWFGGDGEDGGWRCWGLFEGGPDAWIRWDMSCVAGGGIDAGAWVLRRGCRWRSRRELQGVAVICPTVV